MSFAVVFTDRAKTDLRSIYTYIAFTLQSWLNADRQLARIEKEIMSLSEIPERYKRVPLDFGAADNVRMVSVDHYCVIYRVRKKPDTVQILRILYGGRDFQFALEE
jgi:toxin ParE1/3/4